MIESRVTVHSIRVSQSEVALVSDVAAQDETVDLIKQLPAAANNSKDGG